jgi:hypothetical protein
MEAFTVKQKVLFQQRIWFASREQMMWHARHIPSYPLTTKQIEEHFDNTEVGKIRGHMQARHITTRRLTDQEEQRKIDAYLKAAVNPKLPKHTNPMISVPELRNMEIGYQTGSDIAVGPGLTKAVFVDKASGFKWSMTMKNKSQLPEAFSEYCEFKLLQKHTLKEFISDDEAVYKTPEMKRLLTRHKMVARQSPPDEHHMNGHAESANKKSNGMVTSMLQCAQHLTESFWVKAWEQADLLHSLGPCSQPGRGHMTKYEAIRGHVPDLNQIILLPFGQPVEFHVPKDQRGSFHAKSRAGSYIGADLTHPGAIQVWSHATRKSISTTSFKVKHAMPDPDKVFERLMFRDSDDLDNSPVTTLIPTSELEGPTTRGRSCLLDAAQRSTDSTVSTGDLRSEIDPPITIPQRFTGLAQEGAANAVESEVSTSVPSQEGAGNAVESDGRTSVPSSEGAQLFQEGAENAPRGGPTTRRTQVTGYSPQRICAKE